MLVLFADSIGVMPHVQPELIFYSLLTVFGVAFTICAVKFVEKQALTTFGWHLSNLKKNILIGILGIIPLLAFLPVIYFTTNFTISSEFTLEKLILASTFGLILGGFYEEVMFRGIIQYHVGQITTKNRTIIYTAIIFVLTHVGYLPFDAYGIYYWFLFLMALELSYIRSKYNSIS
nr:CPBP family intramembrane metalloprotease [Candidatus Sigynarchaeota archaeon]